MTAAWEEELAALWETLESVKDSEFLVRMDAVTADLPSAIRLFERAAAQDSTEHPLRATELDREALAAGLVGERRRRAVIQLASSLRNVGQTEEALALLTAEAGQPSDALDGAGALFMALTLADLGREREGLAVALTALAHTLPRYNRSAARYAQGLMNAELQKVPHCL